MKSARGFFILENVITFSLGTLLLLSGLRTYNECFITLQKKLLLEQAIALAETSIHKMPVKTNLIIKEKEEGYGNLTIKEVQICHNDKIIFSLAKAK